MQFVGDNVALRQGFFSENFLVLRVGSGLIGIATSLRAGRFGVESLQEQ